jgi:ketosteroid isomerase-like protein
MSRENVEIVRRIYAEGLIDQDPERLLELVTPDIEFVNPPEAVEPGIRRGRAEVAQAMRSAHESFDSYRHELRELFDCGYAVVTVVSFHARGRGSESEVVQEEVHTWTLRDGRLARFEWGRDLKTALEAVGLSE